MRFRQIALARWIWGDILRRAQNTTVLVILEKHRMLVITRREGEEVVIGDPKNPIGVVRIASVKGERVRVAFDFPREVEIHRREIADQIIVEMDESPAVIGEIKPATAQ